MKAFILFIIFAFVVYLSFLVLLTLQQTRSFGCRRTLRKAGEEQLSANISDDAGEQDRDNLRRGLIMIFGRYVWQLTISLSKLAFSDN